MRLLKMLEAWDAARSRPSYRGWGLLIGALAALGAYRSTLDLPEPARGAAAMTVLMAVWWLGGVLPMAVTAMVPLIAMPCLGLGGVADVAASYADPLNVLMFGGFLLAFAMEEVGLHRRVVAWLLAPAWVRRSPRRVALALMFAAAIVSSVINNTATMLMMLPIALGLAKAAGDDARTRAALVLCTAYACSIGGVATLVGTAPNAVFAGLSAKIAGREVGFMAWACVGVSFVLLALPTAWWVVTRVTLPLPAQFASPLAEVPVRSGDIPRRAQGVVAVAVLVCVAAWMTRAPLALGEVRWPGWGGWFPAKVDDGFVAVAVAFVLFCLPADGSRGGNADAASRQGVAGDDAREDAFLLSWRRASHAVPWSVLLLMGGGFAMADAVQDSGLSRVLAAQVSGLAALPETAQVAAVALGIAFLSAFTSNTATTQVALPLLGAGALAAGVDPMRWMVPATIAASCDFALAVGTPPNAIAAESGGVRPADMAASGLILNVACAIVTTVVTLVVARSVL